MESTMMLEVAEFQDPPLLELLLKLSVTFKVLNISPPTSVKIQSTFDSLPMSIKLHNNKNDGIVSTINPTGSKVGTDPGTERDKILDRSLTSGKASLNRG
jgi:hypothetical protein